MWAGRPDFVHPQELLCPFSSCFLCTEFLYLNKLCAAVWVHTCLSDFWLNFRCLLYVSLIHVILKFHVTCCSPPCQPSLSAQAHGSIGRRGLRAGSGGPAGLALSVLGLCYQRNFLLFELYRVLRIKKILLIFTSRGQSLV